MLLQPSLSILKYPSGSAARASGGAFMPALKLYCRSEPHARTSQVSVVAYQIDRYSRVRVVAAAIDRKQDNLRSVTVNFTSFRTNGRPAGEHVRSHPRNRLFKRLVSSCFISRFTALVIAHVSCFVQSLTFSDSEASVRACDRRDISRSLSNYSNGYQGSL